MKHVLVGVYLLIAGISGIVGYCPRKARDPLKDPKSSRSRGSVAIFLIFCTLVTVVVVLDNTALHCISSQGARSNEGWVTSIAIQVLFGMSHRLKLL
ncbi:uncharacterized protein NPIL_278301 [Nephila pilipes]|uniref:Uncharacterized protein n=1 Tax=Nephila pilipes TaxID=299642 RepID=A0A8X6MX95_NEPPI|nr:uncharacterized protein NPIL_278301 [Nephila pilipes]